MTKDEKTATTVVTVALTAFVLVAGPSLGWPAWVWLPVAALPVAAALWLARTVREKREQARIQDEIAGIKAPRPKPPEPEQPRREILADLSLHSAVPDYRFLLSATVYWIPNPTNPGRAHGNLAALAREAIVSRATEVLAKERPEEHSVLTERLNGVLGTPLAVPGAQIDAWAGGVSVTLPDADLKRLYRLAEVRKEEEVWEHERNHERNVREYLGDDVLANPGRAVVWWLARHIEQDDAGLRATVGNIGHLRRLTSAAHATDVPAWSDSEPASTEAAHPWQFPDDPFPPPEGEVPAPRPFVIDSVPTPEREPTPVEQLLGFVEAATADADNDERDMFVDRLARLLDKHENREAAEALRRRFGTAPPTEHMTHVPPNSQNGDHSDRPWSFGPDGSGQV